jgi:hypothetical protein
LWAALEGEADMFGSIETGVELRLYEGYYAVYDIAEGEVRSRGKKYKAS